MQIRVLGHMEASVAGRELPLGGRKPRAVLAMLAIEANHTISADRIIDGLWGDEPPASAAKMVQNYVWRLRGVLAEDGSAEIVTRGRGYELRIDPGCVDVHRAERLIAEARQRPTGTRNAAREALVLFNGGPLADLADEPFAIPEIHRLEELRAMAAELAIEADLEAGRHTELVPELERLLAANPLRERLHAQRMLALYRCGRQAEALEAYRDARKTLVDEIGVEPSAELRRLHDAILRQDPSLDVEPAVAELPPAARRRHFAAPRRPRARAAPPPRGMAPASRAAPGRSSRWSAPTAWARRASRPSSPARSTAEGRPPCMRPGRARRRARWPRSRTRARRAVRPCSCSTTPTARPATCSRPCAISGRRSRAARSWCSRPGRRRPSWPGSRRGTRSRWSPWGPTRSG